MVRQIFNTKDNILTLIIWILVWLGFGFIYSLLSNVSYYLGWVVAISTAGFFFYAGGYLVDEGAFNKNLWKIIFVSLAPFVFLIDYWINLSISWYSGTPGFAFYLLYTLGFLLKKIPDRLSRIIQFMKQIEPEYDNLNDDEIEKQIKSIKKCGYEWYEQKGIAAFKHKESGIYLNIPRLNYYSPDEIIKTYDEVWSKDFERLKSIK